MPVDKDPGKQAQDALNLVLEELSVLLISEDKGGQATSASYLDLVGMIRSLCHVIIEWRETWGHTLSHPCFEEGLRRAMEMGVDYCRQQDARDFANVLLREGLGDVLLAYGMWAEAVDVYSQALERIAAYSGFELIQLEEESGTSIRIAGCSKALVESLHQQATRLPKGVYRRLAGGVKKGLEFKREIAAELAAASSDFDHSRTGPKAHVEPSTFTEGGRLVGMKHLFAERGARALSMFGYAVFGVTVSAVFAEIDLRTLFLGEWRGLISVVLGAVFAVGASWLAGRSRWWVHVARALLAIAVASLVTFGLLTLGLPDNIGPYAMSLCIGAALAGTLSFIRDKGSSRASLRLACNILAVFLATGAFLFREQLPPGLDSILPVVSLISWMGIAAAVILVLEPVEKCTRVRRGECL